MSAAYGLAAKPSKKQARGEEQKKGKRYVIA